MPGGSGGGGGVARSDRTTFRGHSYALVICRHPRTKKYLAVNESRNRGWWIPGGGVDGGETFRRAAVREAREEAGVDVELKGLLRVEHYLHGKDGFKMRVVFYAEPADPDRCDPKSVPDEESEGAAWVTLLEFSRLGHVRGRELLEFGALVEEGRVLPLDAFEEG